MPNMKYSFNGLNTLKSDSEVPVKKWFWLVTFILCENLFHSVFQLSIHFRFIRVKYVFYGNKYENKKLVNDKILLAVVDKPQF